MVAEVITDEPASVFRVGRALVGGTASGDPSPKGETLHITRAEARFDGSWLLGFAELPDRDHTAAWRIRYLLVPRTELTPPAEGEIYLHELSGMRVALESGVELGQVKDVLELPTGLALDVAWEQGTVLLPYVFVRRVDREKRLITAAPPDGLFE